MPMLIPLAASAFSISTGMAAIGAAGGLMTGGGLLGGLMVAGGALGGIGALTGNKKLMKIGAVLGLAGGVGNLLSNAGTEAAKAGVSDAAGKAASDAANATAGNTVADVTGTAAGGVSEAAKVAGSVAEADQGLINSALASGAPAQQGAAGLANGVDPYAAGSGWGGDTLKAMGVANDTAPGWADKLTGAVNNVMPGAGSTMRSAIEGTKGLIGDVAGWAEKNPNTAKLAGGMVGGAMSYAGQVQAAKDAQRRQMSYQDWVRQRYSDSVANLRIPSPLSTPTAPAGIIGGLRG